MLMINQTLHNLSLGMIVAPAFFAVATAQDIKPSRSEIINPIHIPSFNKNGKAKERKQGGNPRMVEGYQVFDGSMDGNRQVDPQIAVGGGHVLHGTNGGFVIYDKKGHYIQGVKQSVFNGGIDPKLFFDLHNKVFKLDLSSTPRTFTSRPRSRRIKRTMFSLGFKNVVQICLSVHAWRIAGPVTPKAPWAKWLISALVVVLPMVLHGGTTAEALWTATT